MDVLLDVMSSEVMDVLADVLADVLLDVLVVVRVYVVLDVLEVVKVLLNVVLEVVTVVLDVMTCPLQGRRPKGNDQAGHYGMSSFFIYFTINIWIHLGQNGCLTIKRFPPCGRFDIGTDSSWTVAHTPLISETVQPQGPSFHNPLHPDGP